jgi:DNA-binding response OmpR family regulator/curved DNA-binding protein CbpA
MSRTILIVDDDREVQRYLTEIFEAEGWRVIAEKDGDWALKAFEQRPVDAIVLDILIPVVNGFQVAEQVRAHPRGKDVPIVMLTGIYRGAAHRAEAIRRYALLDYMDKPVEGQRVLAKLKEALAERAPAQRFTPTELPKPSSQEVSREHLADDEQKREKREVERAAAQISESDNTGAVLRGNLKRLPFPRLLHRLYLKRANGALFLLKARIKKIVYFKDGHPTYIKSNVLSECLGRVLVRERLISEEECEASLRKMRDEKRQQGAILIGMGVISPHNLKYGLELQLQVKLFDIFSWADAEYQFRDDVKIPNDVITMELPNGQIILEGIRRTYDRARVEAALAPMMSNYVRPARDPALRFQQMGLEDDEKAYLENIDGTRTLKECLANAPMGEMKALVSSYAMLCAGVLETDELPLRRSDGPAAQAEGDAELPVPVLRPRIPTQPLSPVPHMGEPQANGLSRERLAANLLTLRNQDHFSVLGVGYDAPSGAVERAYERLAREYHPDRFRDRGNDTRKIAAEIFDRVGEAHKIVSDPDARKRYADDLRKQGAPAPGDPAGRALASDRYFRAGEELLRQRRFGESAEAFRRATELSPESAEYRAYLGWALFLQDPRSEQRALDELEEATRLNPKLDRAYLFLGYIHRDGGRPEDAEQQFSKAIQCNPDCSEALRELRALQARG